MRRRLKKAGATAFGDEHHDVVAVHPDAERGEKAALRGAVARIADFVGEARDGVRKLAVQERDGVLARDAHQTVFGDAAAGGGRREGKSACVVAGVGGRAGIGVAVHRNSARKPLSSDRGGSAVLLSKFG